MLKRQKTRGAAIAALVTAGLVLSGCAADDTPASSDAQLDIQYFGSVVTLDPALSGQGPSANIIALAYDPLIYMTPDGEYIPDLATDWGYTDDENTEFEFTLRDGVTFSSGAELDADAAVASMEYFLDSGGGTASQVGDIDSIEAVDEATVRITYTEPFPDAEWTLSQYIKFGSIIGPDGLADPEALSTEMDGTGQYVYNAAESVANASYVFDRNPDYWNADAQMYERVTVRAISDENAALSAIQTGQVDYTLGAPSTLDAAEDAGLEVLQVPFFNWAIHIADRTGELTPALEDPRVREAIAISIDRQAIVDAVSPDTAQPSSQLLNEGAVGFVPGLEFDYDPERAQQLLADAGYPDGFSMSILSTNSLDQNAIRAQAIVSYLEAIGIDVDLTADATGVSGFVEESQTGKYSATIFPMSGTTMGLLYPTLRSGPRNPSAVLDSEMESLFSSSRALAAEKSVPVYEQMSELAFANAWNIPIFTANDIHYIGPELAGVKVTNLNPIPIAVAPDPQYAWHPSA
ncbi:ABC transporter substrate-binding protein [Paramicrobacterium fandaimingii]|uniref:ABC transporter substrate-binding protein n=1 Tax=Paramicrobacterium fandaimingii TaxID=2708079 RepID=UPI00141FB260|nr:ABC transporter substrate-binding protein [Microbacterium fandaimingii]